MKYLREGEMEALISGCSGRYAERDRAILGFLGNTGVRVSEMCGLNLFEVLDIDGEVRKEIWLRDEICKRRKGRRIPLNSRGREAVRVLREENPVEVFSAETALVVSGKRVRMTSRQVERIVERARKRAGILTVATPHSFRHTVGKGLSRGKGIEFAAKMLGHSSLDTTRIYTEVGDEELGEAMEGI